MTRHAGTAGGVFDPPAAPRDQIRRRAAPGAYWLSPPGLVMLTATALALAVRLYLLGRPGYLTGITEYDDGVYLGGAISLISGMVPYHDFAFVQPPGILLLMTPVAVLAKVSAPAIAMAAARLLTAVASAACVGLAGALVRHRGTGATLVACGVLALYPDDIMSAHTLLLEPWMNLLLLSGACAAFRDGAFRDGAFGDGAFRDSGFCDRAFGGSAFPGGRLVSSRRLLWAGILFGLACAVKYWAAIPAACMIAACLFARPDGTPGGVSGTAAGQVTGDPARRGTARRLITSSPRQGTPVNGFRTTGRPGRAAWFTVGLVAGFAVPVLPFAVRWPGLFLRSTVLDQASRTGSAVPEPLRLAHLTGLAAVLNDAGRLTVSGDEGTLFARADVAAAATWATGWLPVALALVFAVLLCLGYALGRARARRTPPGRARAAPADPASAGPYSTDAGSTDAGSTGPASADAGSTDSCGADERASREARVGADTRAETAASGPGPVEMFALAVLCCTLVAVLGYSAFFYHYADLPAPWLAVTAGYSATALRGTRFPAPAPRGTRDTRPLPATLGDAPSTQSAAPAPPSARTALFLTATLRATRSARLPPIVPCDARDNRPFTATPRDTPNTQSPTPAPRPARTTRLLTATLRTRRNPRLPPPAPRSARDDSLLTATPRDAPNTLSPAPAPPSARTTRLLTATLRATRSARLPPTAPRDARDNRLHATALSRRPGRRHGAWRAPRCRRGGLIVWLAAGLVLVAAFEAWEVSGLHAPSVSADAALITPGACVVSDEISLAIAADRFTAGSGGCPDVLDSLAATLVAGNGVSVEGGAQALPQVGAYWQAVFSRARYVWLSGSSDRRIPWTTGLRAWFARNFRALNPPAGQHREGQVYIRRA